MRYSKLVLTALLAFPASAFADQSKQEQAERLQRKALNGKSVRVAAPHFAGKAAPAPVVAAPQAEHFIEAASVLPRYGRRDKAGRFKYLVSVDEQKHIASLAVAEAEKQGLDPAFVLSFIGQESGYYAKAKGDAGEIGLMQLLPVTARTMLLREDPKARLTDKKVAKLLQDPALNIRLGVTLLKELQDNLEDLARRKRVDMRKVMAAGYNAGQVAVAKTLEKHKRTPKLTEVYVTGIMGKVQQVNKQAKKAAAGSI